MKRQDQWQKEDAFLPRMKRTEQMRMRKQSNKKKKKKYCYHKLHYEDECAWKDRINDTKRECYCHGMNNETKDGVTITIWTRRRIGHGKRRLTGNKTKHNCHKLRDCEWENKINGRKRETLLPLNGNNCAREEKGNGVRTIKMDASWSKTWVINPIWTKRMRNSRGKKVNVDAS